MPSLRLFRSGSARPAEPADVGADGGLLAFASETPAVADLPPAAAVNPRTRLIIAALAAVALLEAAPTFLWIKSRFTTPAVVTAANSLPPAPVAPPSAALAACEPASLPAPAPPAPAPAAAPTATAGAAPAAPSPSMMAGMISVNAVVPMQVFRAGRLVGTTEAETIMLPVGNHDLEFRNDSVGYRVRRAVTVQAGRTATVRLDPPAATLSINAIPWAEVWIDNQRIGETPIANAQTTLGSHEIVFRHPELGERRTTVLVTLKEPARVSMDLRKK
jgi:hypothetical protein